MIKGCPVCGKQPRIKCKQIGVDGAWCTVQCKPFLRKPHLKVEEGKALYTRAIECAIARWNAMAIKDADLR